jgi:N-methylhydantoinase B
VRRDVAEGWISRERARDVYRVELDQAGSVDLLATEALRRHSHRHVP